MSVIAWRITKTRHAAPFDATGARLVGARWNSPGIEVIYASDSFAGAILEILAHVRLPRTLPGAHHAVQIDIPDRLIEMLDESTLPGWELPGSAQARAWGDAWIAQQRSPAASLPSLPARPIGRTIAINPLHPATVRLTVSEPFGVPWDASSDRVSRSQAAAS